MMEYPHYYHNIPKIHDERSGTDLYVAEVVPQNIVQRLAARELWGGRRAGTERYLERSMYQSIYPDFTIANIDKPPCFLRKFSPDGKSFIAFSSDQMSVEVYTFMGPAAGQHLFRKDEKKNRNRSGILRHTNQMAYSAVGQAPMSPLGLPSSPAENLFFMDQLLPEPSSSAEGYSSETPILPLLWSNHISAEDTRPESKYIRENIFETYFKLKHRIPVAPQGEQLNRECSLFTENSQYIIVGSAAYVQDEYMVPSYYEINRSNESTEPNPRFPLEDYTIHIVDIVSGSHTDSHEFKIDKIFLSHNQGIYLYNQTLAVLSVQHQCIYIFNVTEAGQLHLIRTIGRFCYEDDEFLIASLIPNFTNIRPAEDRNINQLKHRLLVKIFNNALITLSEEGDHSGLTRFYQYYEQIKKLRLWKMELLDENHLLLKYSSEDVVTIRNNEPNSQHCMFVIYCIESTEVLAVYENTSEELVDLFENFTDNFRNNFMVPGGRYSSSPANNIYSRQIQHRFRQTITSARFGGPVEATKRILAQLPISAQSFSASPYLDQALFSYDDHRVSIMERPKACGEIPIRFYGRDSGIYKFELHAGILPRGSSQSGRRLVAFTFHPSAPFAISVQRANADYLVNFHIRMSSQEVLSDVL